MAKDEKSLKYQIIGSFAKIKYKNEAAAGYGIFTNRTTFYRTLHQDILRTVVEQRYLASEYYISMLFSVTNMHNLARVDPHIVKQIVGQ